MCHYLNRKLYNAGDAAKDSASLGSLMRSVLCAAASINAKALAFPLLGGGVAGWSTSLAAQALVAQVIHAANHCSLGDELRVRQLFVQSRIRCVCLILQASTACLPQLVLPISSVSVPLPAHSSICTDCVS